MDDKTLLSPRPTLSIGLSWLLCTLLAVITGAIGTVLLMGGGATSDRPLGPGLALFAVTIVAAVGGVREAFRPLVPAVSVSAATAVPVLAEVVRVNPAAGRTFGTFTVRFATAGGAPQEGEMVMTAPADVGRRIPGRFDPTNPRWVVPDGPNIVSVIDQAFKGSLAVGVLLLVCVPFV
ncbi:MAG: DUF3592 domain-containing protein [Solirubrobacteraceae bacterium]|nr:hypothetical protein [Patulibacter sp.]